MGTGNATHTCPQPGDAKGTPSCVCRCRRRALQPGCMHDHRICCPGMVFVFGWFVPSLADATPHRHLMVESPRHPHNTQVSGAAARSLLLLQGCTGSMASPRLWPEDAFAALFLTTPGPTARGDCWFRVTTHCDGGNVTGPFSADTLPALATASTLSSLVLRGLGDRAVLCHAAPLPWGSAGGGQNPAKGALRPWEGPCTLLLSVQV